MKPTRKGELLTLGLFFCAIQSGIFPQSVSSIFFKCVSNKNIEFMFAGIKIQFTPSGSTRVKMRVKFTN